MRDIRLTGLDGSNLLAFLAALGTLRALTLAEGGSGTRMRWDSNRSWVPVIANSTAESEEDLLAILESAVAGEESISDAWKIGEDLTLGLEDFRNVLLKCMAVSSAGQRTNADFLTAFGSDGIGSRPKKDQMSDTEFRTMSGAGHQHFLGFMKELAAGTNVQHLKRTLFAQWDYGDGRPSLRWDPADYRPHALRANDPSGDPIRTMRGANRLAVEALPLFPTAPESRQLRTLGFKDRDRETEVTWPIWNEALDLRTLESLLGLSDLQEDKIDGRRRSVLERRGINQVFRAKRFTDGKYRNFSPARALM
jgi:hypothetical protein